ncbi:nitrous oxide reductase family maturation protein NosD [Paenibacillus sp. R14(2021)]|uniref:right-handed parallel beta-helix repeat-containing protein n=1 Tax=Paenibacillus sp. R14(2021) TaxID=2859228 RepID=UPI001C6160F9|nr:glycosyl hydrolase family 28-related protein [Paenibacillus sp. R14(2021)]
MGKRELDESPKRMNRRAFLAATGSLVAGYLLANATGVKWLNRMFGTSAEESSALAPVPTEPMARAIPAAEVADWINVKNYGAEGDNKKDDTNAIKAAIQAASKRKGAVYFPEGTYVVTQTLKISSPLSLIGAGMNASIIRMKAVNVDGILVTETSDVFISQLQVRDVKNTKGGENTGIHLRDAKNAVVEHCRIYNSDDSGIRVGYGRNSVSKGCKLLYCDVEKTNRGSGIEVIRAADTLVQGCSVRDSFQHGIRLCGASGPVVVANRTYASKFSEISIQGFGANEVVTHPVTNFMVNNNYCRGDGKNSGLTVFNSAENGTVSDNVFDNNLIGLKIYDSNGYGNRDIVFLGNTVTNNGTGVYIRGSERRLAFRQNTISDFQKSPDSTQYAYAFQIEGYGKTLDLTIENNDITNKLDANGRFQVAIGMTKLADKARVFFRNNTMRLSRSQDDRYFLFDGSGTFSNQMNGTDTNTLLPYE